ncbi:nociceptin receptor isoform X2 [Globicephala melas]|uniref:nociceptin receptor isoform X2 n=1 Tax=Globicephala melas TaxID=9731 RepID=UPI00293D5510|nr:nociceptin receptor isoform X2 [Globicephala melas]XP_060149374.1 nociceptin receptor isoform X2 [Globicephala melas]
MSRWRPLLRSDPAPPWVPSSGPSGPCAAGLCAFATTSHTSRVHPGPCLCPRPAWGPLLHPARPRPPGAAACSPPPAPCTRLLRLVWRLRRKRSSCHRAAAAAPSRPGAESGRRSQPCSAAGRGLGPPGSQLPRRSPRYRGALRAGRGMESLFPAPFWEVLYGGHLQGNLSLLSPNHSLLPPHLMLNASHGAFLPLGLKVTIVGLYLAVCVGGLLGNCLVMYVILRHTKMKTATNIYIFNLALADTLVLLTLPFQGTDVLLGFWPFGNALCKTVIAIDYYNMFTSTFTLTAMSVDRYIAICHPIRALDVRTSSKAQAVNVAIWALASVVGVPVAIMGSAQVEDEEIECLVEIPTPQDYWGPVFAICIFLFSFIMPVLIISVCYSLMIRRLRGVRLLSGSREKDRNLRRITRLVLVVVAVFVGCWTPVQVFVLVQGLGVQPGSETVVAILRFCTALGYVNSCLNPILYAFLDENFKACFRKFCCAPTLRREMQVSDRVRSIAKDVAHARKTSEMVPRPA